MEKKPLLAIIFCLSLLVGCAIQNKPDTGGNDLQENLFQAAEQGETAAIRNLILNGANVDAQDTQGRTALMIATYRNDVESAKVLIEAGADVNIRDRMKNSPFLYAGAEGYLEIVRLTIDGGADPAITNRYGGTALIPASEHGYVEVVKEILTRTNVNVNHVNNLGWTALLEAIILNRGDEKQQQTIRLLIEHGADVNISDKDKVTPLQHAKRMGFKEIEQILVDAGAR